jgi:hypothetical protein
MKRFLVVMFFILGLGVVLDANARDIYVDNKSLCEKTKGTWRAFNNNCADVCDNKFENLVCTAIPIMDCECGVKRCWDGGKCISEKLARSIWDEKNKLLVEDRERELKELEEERVAIGLPPTPPVFDPEIHGQNAQVDATKKIPVANPINPNSTKAAPSKTVASRQIDGFIKSMTETPKKELPPVKVVNTSPEDKEKSLEEQKICESQNGSWQTFNNGCADACASKVTEISMCTQSLTKGCKCGGSKCWDVSTRTCAELEDYKLTMQAQKNNEAIKDKVDSAAKLFDSIPFPTVPTF